MIDRVVLGLNEVVIVDTTNNCVSILNVSNVNVNINTLPSGPQIALLGQYEHITLPINSGRYQIINQNPTNAILYIFRYFVF